MIRQSIWFVILVGLAGIEVWAMGDWMLGMASEHHQSIFSGGLALFIHLVSASIGSLAILLIRRDQTGSTLAFLTYLLSLFIPVVGLPFMAFISLLQKFEPLKANVVRNYKQDVDLLSKTDYTVDRPLDDAIRFLTTELSVEPLADLISSDDPDMRRGAITTLRRLKNPGAIRLLKQARTDLNPELRVHASTALAGLDSEMSEALEAAIKKVEEHPDDVEVLMNQSEAAMAYVRSGLLDEESLDDYYKIAALPARQVLRTEPGNVDALDIFGQVFLLRGQPGKAERIYNRIIAIKGEWTPALLGLAESLYGQLKLKELGTVCHRLAEVPGGNKLKDQVRVAVEMWKQ